MTKPVLYSYWQSTCSWRVRAALAYKGIEYECRSVDLFKDGGEQHLASYAKLNPSEFVPTLIIDGHCLTESMAIMEYLEETHPSPPLLPKDPLSRAKVRALSLIIVSGIQPLQNDHVLEYIGEKQVEWATRYLIKGFTALENMLKDTSGLYAFGDSVTMADFCIVPQVYRALRFNINLNEFPIIKRINDELLKLESFKDSHPASQPDAKQVDKIQ